MFDRDSRNDPRRLARNYVAGGPSLDDAPAQRGVILWDERRSRLPKIQNLISQCGARPFLVSDALALEAVECSSVCNTAVVALGAHPAPEDLSLKIIHTLKQKSFKIISYAEDTQSWPLSRRCRPLLAGSSWLLDSARPGFESELPKLLAQLLRAEGERRDEEERVRGLMEQLGIVGESRAIVSLFRRVVRLSALSDLSTLITGETGTGKELLANAIYRLDPKRSRGPFVVVNCGAISPWLAESELFGHRRGAFTGADRDRNGLIRTAQGGVLFMDEIGELDLALQTKLLRVLQENRVLGVGEDKEVPVNVRIIAATNRDLMEMIKQGKFRADLFHRLNTLSVHVPPLRERPEDLKPLIEHFVKKHQSARVAEPVTTGQDFVEALAQIELPGNARQLENIVRGSLIGKSNSSPLGLSDLPPEVWQELSKQPDDDPAPPSSEGGKPSEASFRTAQHDVRSYLSKLLDINGWNLSQSLEHCEKLLVESALRLAHGNQSKTARLLGITPRSVYNKVRKHRLRYE